MKELQGAGCALRKIALITLAGFLVVMLAGPVLTLLGMMLPFALAGLLVYVPYRAIRLGREGGWAAVRGAARKSLRVMLTPPLWVLGHAVGGVKCVLGFGLGLVGL